MELILLALAFWAGGFLAELLLLRLTRTKWKVLRALPLLVVVGLWWLAWIDYNRPTFFIGMNELAAFVDVAAGTLILLGYGLAGLVFHRKKKSSSFQAELQNLTKKLPDEKTINLFLFSAVIVPLILLFWPFATWNNPMSLSLRMISAFSAQMLLCRIGRCHIVTVIPLFLTGAIAAWGTYLYLVSPHWIHATFGGFMADYVSPFICCAITLVVYQLKRNNQIPTEFSKKQRRPNGRR